MKILNLLFPFKTQLTVFQLEEYHVYALLKWLRRNPSMRSLEEKKGLKWTSKAKTLLLLTILLYAICLIPGLLFTGDYLRITYYVLWIFLLSQPYIFLILASIIFSPFENWKKNQIKKQMVEKIKSLPNLKIIGVVGSYGKTSVKEFLYEMLKTKFRVLKTPENYNTTLSIAKVIDLELDEKYDFFICEKGAYKIGNIKKFFELVKPDYGILTGINEQHLEKFGSIKNIIKAKFEIVESLPKNGFCFVNVDDENVDRSYRTYSTYTSIIPYGFSNDKFSVKNVKTNDNETSFDLILDRKSFSCETKLFGNANLINILGAAGMAYKLGVEPEKIVRAIKNLESFPHRMEIKKINGAILIDDAYSSNPAGFREALNLLKAYTNPKILVTPGIIELGGKNEEIHRKLGQLADQICDAVILVGENERTLSFEKGLSKIKPIYIDSVKELWTTVGKLGYENPVALLENDLPENY